MTRNSWQCSTVQNEYHLIKVISTFALPITRVLIVPKVLQCTVHTSWLISVPIGKQRDTALHTCGAETRHRDAGSAMMKPLTAAAIASSSMDSLAVSQREEKEGEGGRRNRDSLHILLLTFPIPTPKATHSPRRRPAVAASRFHKGRQAGGRYVGAQMKRQRRPWAPLPTTFLLRAPKPTWIPAELC